jgi:hypothetical protein
MADEKKAEFFKNGKPDVCINGGSTLVTGSPVNNRVYDLRRAARAFRERSEQR